MTKSPLARVVASKPVPAPVVAEAVVNHMLGESVEAKMNRNMAELAIALGEVSKPSATPAPKGWDVVGTVTPDSRPHFGKFIDEFCEKNKLNYTPYVDSEAKVRADTAKITAALAEAFPAYDVHEVIEGADHKPPFAAWWDFTPKKAGNK